MRVFEGFQRGVNLGGWLSQCDETTKSYYDTFITQDDIKQIAKAGLDHVRVPVDYMLLEQEDGTAVDTAFTYLDQCLAWCREYGLHLLVDLHKTYGYSFDPLDTGLDRDRFFADPALQERFFALWERIAAHFAADTDTVAFELLNEIVSSSSEEAWNAVADQAMRRIRKVTPDAWIVVGGVRYNHVLSVPNLRKPLDEKIVYNFHCYQPLLFTHQRAYWVDNMPGDLVMEYPGDFTKYKETALALCGGQESPMYDVFDLPGLTRIDKETFVQLFAPAVRYAEENDAPLYCGEYGVIDQAPVEDTLRWLKDIQEVFDRFGIGRALWTWKKKDFGLVDEHYAPIREEMLRVLGRSDNI